MYKCQATYKGQSQAKSYGKRIGIFSTLRTVSHTSLSLRAHNGCVTGNSTHTRVLRRRVQRV